jgi:hypothetical protein
MGMTDIQSVLAAVTLLTVAVYVDSPRALRFPLLPHICSGTDNISNC